jgi:predicted Zn-dependent protease
MRRFRVAVGFVAVAVVAGCATVVNPVTGESERTVMDEQREIAEGAKAHPQVVEEFGEYNDPQVQAFFSALGKRLATVSQRPQLEWHFTVLDSPEINAFALPGGYVYVTRGIMAYMDSEADLAGVTGHEIGHVTARHGSQRATRQQAAGIGVMAATILGAVLETGGVPGAAQAASQASQGLAAGYIAKYSRAQESQADQLGAEYLAGVNYDPRNMVDVIKVLESQERFAADEARAEGRTPQSGSDWLASHPANAQRLRDITQVAAGYEAKMDFGDEGRAAYLEMIDGMPFGESSSQGVTRGQNFYHEPLDFALTAPQGWQIQNTPQAVVIVSAARDAALLVQAVPAEAGRTHDEVIRNGVNPNAGNVERRTINGLSATHFVGTRVNEQGQLVSVELTIVSGPSDRMYAMVYAARDQQVLQQSRRQMRAAESSFRALTADDRKAAQPWKLKSVPLPAGGFAELARRSPLPNAEQQLRLLNGVYGGGDIAPGQLVKIVE